MEINVMGDADQSKKDLRKNGPIRAIKKLKALLPHMTAASF